MMREMPAEVFEAWRIWARANPFGPNEEALRAAWTPVFAFNLKRQRGTDPMEPADLFPQLRQKVKPVVMTPEEAVAEAKAWTLACGGIVKDKRNG